MFPKDFPCISCLPHLSTCPAHRIPVCSKFVMKLNIFVIASSYIMSLLQNVYSRTLNSNFEIFQTTSGFLFSYVGSRGVHFISPRQKTYVLYPMMNFSQTLTDCLHIQNKIRVDSAYLYKTNFQNANTAVMSNNMANTCSPPPPTLRRGSSITLTRVLTCDFSLPYFSIGVCSRESLSLVPCR
jgi:hypothetical protein